MAIHQTDVSSPLRLRLWQLWHRWADPDRAPALVAAGAVYLLVCLLIQGTSGAWNATFNAYPDEPSHFVSAVMIRDYLASGFSLSPFRFAEQYYRHYPFFAVGYWPPLCYVITAFVFLVAGVGRFQALFVSAAAAAGSACLLFSLLRKRSGFVVAFCVGLLFLSLVEVQRWMSAVMTDEMVVFFCLAAGIRLLIWLERPTYWNAIFCGTCCAFATLTKYSGAYVCIVPFATCLILRRFSLLRKQQFLVLHATVVLLVGPWLLWTASRSSTGLPPSRPPILSRVLPFIRSTFEVFSPTLMVVVILGLLALVMLRRMWQADLLVVSLLGLGSLGFLIASPVDPELRYVMGVAAALLVLAASGWSGLSELAGRANGLLPVLTVILTAAVMATHFGDYKRPPDYPIRLVVNSVVMNPAWSGKRIVVASDLEGPMIAEFAIQDTHRPGYELVRPSKLLSGQGWFGENYVSRYGSPQEVASTFERDSVDLIIWHSRPASGFRKHELLMDQMLHDSSFSWNKVVSFSDWSVYAKTVR